MYIVNTHRTHITGEAGQVIAPGVKVQVKKEIGDALIKKGLAEDVTPKPKQDSSKGRTSD